VLKICGFKTAIFAVFKIQKSKFACGLQKYIILIGNARKTAIFQRAGLICGFS
jgi:hypothetical protein